MQLVITVKDGATAQDMAHALRFQAGLLEGMPAKEASSRKNTSATTTTTDDDDDEDDTDFKTATKAKSTSFDDDDDDDDTETKPTKKASKKGPTLDDVNDAAKAFATSIGGKPGRDAVLKILKKNFKTESISGIDEKHYPKLIELLAVEED